MKKIGIYGAGAAGRLLAADLSLSKAGKVEFFIDDDPNLIGHDLFGCPIVSLFSVRNLELHQHIDEIIIALPSAPVDLLESIHNNLREFNKPIYSVPTEANYSTRPLSSNDIVPYLVTNLVGRQMVNIETGLTRAFIEGKHVLITGAGGSIGSEIAKQCAMLAPSIITLIDSSEYALYAIDNALRSLCKPFTIRAKLANICDIAAIRNILKCTPDVVFHAAAYKHVPLMEQFPWQAVQTNVFGTFNLVKLAVRFKAEKFVFISSDKAVNPTSVMGATKRLAEIIVQSFSSTLNSTRFVVTRFGNVLGSNGSVVPLFKKQIQNGGPVTVTHPEMTRYFMTIAEACQLVLEASVMAEGGEVFVFDMGEPVKIVDLARNMIRLAGYTPDVDMQIQFIGERPGEKLYEDLFSESEEMKETHHEKIMISKESIHAISEAENIISKLQTLENFYEPELFRIIIKELLPEYQSVMADGKVVNFRSGKRINQYNYQN